MHEQRFSVLLSDANRQVQIADHLLTVTYPMVKDPKLLLTVTYPMVKDPKLLLSVVEHGRRAIEDAAAAVVELHVAQGNYEVPKGFADSLTAFSDLVKVRRPGIAAEADAIKLCQDFRTTLQQHKESPTTFSREEKLVIASEGFTYLKEITPAELKRSLVTLKQFVHAANQHVAKQ